MLRHGRMLSLLLILPFIASFLVGCDRFNVQSSGDGRANISIDSKDFSLRLNADERRGVQISARGKDFSFDQRLYQRSNFWSL